MTHRHELRVLAFDARRSQYGYALFEGPKRLIDWGTGIINANAPYADTTAMVSKRINRLFDHRLPAVVVVKYAHRVDLDSDSLCLITRTILNEAEMRKIPIKAIFRKEIREAFHSICAAHKEDIAETIARMFPELQPRLPLKRRIWRSEPHAMRIFDAAAAGLTFWWRGHDITLSPQE